MKKTTYNVQWMHCNSCKLLLENSISKLWNIKNVDASISKWVVTISHEQDINENEIKDTINACWYKVVEEKISRPRLSKSIKDYKIFILSLFLFLLLYFILKNIWIFNSNISSQSSPSLGLVVLIGLTAWFSSCMAIVWWLILAISSKRNEKNQHKTFWEKIVPQLRFHFWRIVWFAVLWWLLWLFWSFIKISPLMMSIMTLIVGVVMLLLWINLTNISPKISWFSISLPTGKLLSKKPNIIKKRKWIMKYLSAILSGTLTFFLPCWFTFAMQLYAVSAGNFLIWAAIMWLFAIGTLPWLLWVWTLTTLFKWKIAKIFFQSIWVLVLILWLYNISNAYSIIASFNGNNNQIDINQTIETINMQYTDEWLFPKVLNLQLWHRYKIIIEVQTTIYSCLTTIYIPGLDNNYQELIKWKTVTFNVNANKPWEYPFVCASMWMSHWSKIVIK